MRVCATNINPLELAWAAGLIDGEGWIGILRFKRMRSGYGYSGIISVGMTNVAPIHRLYEIFRCGTITTERQHKPHHKPKFNWDCRTNEVAAVLKQIYPYLCVKKEQAKYVMEFIGRKTRCSNQGIPKIELTQREFFYNLLRGTNRKGNNYG